MEYLITFLEGILTFISPCLLPMIPIYLTYMAGGDELERRPALRALGFVLGFSLVFMLIGVAITGFGRFILKNSSAINLIGGLIIIVMGINFTGIFKLHFLGIPGRYLALATSRLLPTPKAGHSPSGFFSALVFGAIFALGWTPCVGTFLGAALTLAASTGDLKKGLILVSLYCLGLGIPFILSALFIRELGGAFTFIKKHYGVINLLSGLFLIVLGVLMMLGRISI